MADLGSIIQTSNEITNTRESAEVDTSLLENSYYHQGELAVFCFSEWHDNAMVMFFVCNCSFLQLVMAAFDGTFFFKIVSLPGLLTVAFHKTTLIGFPGSSKVGFKTNKT